MPLCSSKYEFRISPFLSSCFFFNDTATTEIYTLSLHDALPIWPPRRLPAGRPSRRPTRRAAIRSEEHTSELQSRRDLVCRLRLEKKKKLNKKGGGKGKGREEIKEDGGK